MKNPFERLEQAIRAEFSSVALRQDFATNPKGPSFLDIVRGAYEATVEFHPGKGYGVTAPANDDFGVGPDEVFPSEERAIPRVLELVRTRGKTTPPSEVSLKRLREIRRLTQEELARKLDVKQATVSKLESRDELLVSTLQKVVNALGGRLELIARFPDGSVTLELGEADLRRR